MGANTYRVGVGACNEAWSQTTPPSAPPKSSSLPLSPACGSNCSFDKFGMGLFLPMDALDTRQCICGQKSLLPHTRKDVHSPVITYRLYAQPLSPHLLLPLSLPLLTLLSSCPRGSKKIMGGGQPGLTSAARKQCMSAGDNAWGAQKNA